MDVKSPEANIFIERIGVIVRLAVVTAQMKNRIQARKLIAENSREIERFIVDRLILTTKNSLCCACKFVLAAQVFVALL